jgi:hypothetical protein
MKNIWDWIKNNPNRTMFLVPIILVAGISISHVVAWYDIANPISWAVYLSIAIEVAAMTALVAVMNRIKGGVWFMFGLVTFIQMIGNIFFSFNEVDSEGELFKSWIELTSPLWDAIGSDINDVVSMKRWLAFLEGGLLPIISLTSLHFFIKYDDKPLTLNSETKNKDEILKTEVENSFSPFNVLNEDLDKDSKNNIESFTEDSKKNNESSTENSTSNSVTSTEKVIQNTTSAAEEIVETPVVEKVIETTSTPEEIVEKTNTPEEIVDVPIVEEIVTVTPEEIVEVPIVEEIVETTSTPEEIVDVPIVEEIVDVPIVEEIVDVPIVEEIVDVPIVEEIVDVPIVEEIVDVPIVEEVVDIPIVEEVVDIPIVEEVVDIPIVEEVVEITNIPEEIINVPIVEDVNETTEVKIKKLSYKRTS